MNKLYISIPSYLTKLLTVSAFNIIAVLMMADAPIFFLRKAIWYTLDQRVV